MPREQELLAKISELETELKQMKRQKRYGLVWEDKREDVIEKCKTELPVLIGDESKTIQEDPNGPTHILIEWDNYHALSVLAYTHEKKVDVIYIDPPYNTWAKNWKYNNDYVDKDDAYRHSKWLSLMKHRLEIAKNLLSEKWVLICAIDENEHAHLVVQLEEIFTDSEIHSVVILHNPKGVQWKNLSYTHEYAVFVIPKDTKSIIDRNLQESEMYISNLRNWGSESLRTDAKNCFYPIIIKDDKIVGFGEVATEDMHPISSNEARNNEIWIWPIDEKGIERKWRYARQTVEEIINVLQIKKSKKGGIQIMIAKDYGTYKTVWFDKRFDASEYGTKLLRKIIPGCDFDFPKSLYTVYDAISSVVWNKKNSLILDFFAGSGTTWHAVLELNKEDGGNRQFILCTNNENKIAEDVTYPRIRNVILGYGDVAGIPANLRYYRTGFIAVDKSIDDLRARFMGRCSEMLQVRENCFSSVTREDEAIHELISEYFQVFENRENILAILYDPYDDLPKLEKLSHSSAKPIIVYIFSMSPDIWEEEISHFANNIRIETIPDEILETYKKIFGF